MNKAIFTDKDGTLIKNVPYNVDPERIELQPFAGEALKQLQDVGYKIIAISNQSGVARGLFRETKLADVEREMANQLENYGVILDAFYYCPHLSAAEGSVDEYSFNCNCRKPKPGLLLKAATANSINLDKSWMIGDILNDTEAGNRAGCNTILYDSGGETEWSLSKKRMPDYAVSSWKTAQEIILAENEINTTEAIARSNSAGHKKLELANEER